MVQEWASETLEEMEELCSSDKDSARRFLHNVKGTAGFFKLKEFVELAHNGEDLLKNESKDVDHILEKIKKELKRILTPNDQLQDPYVRVRKDLLTQIAGWTQELALMNNQLEQHIPDSLKQKLSHIISTLQDTVSKTRMGFLSYFLRDTTQIVQDTAKQHGKKVKFALVGADVEMDREVLTLLKQPLHHILRNSIDHGIETPNVRKKAGKEQEGQIQMVIHRERSQIRIEITDDGAGINLNKVRQKLAIGNAQQLSKKQLLETICQLGFSTKNRVTQISGRGIGMNAVKTAMENFHGHLKINTEEGKGTRVELTIPIKHMIMPVITFSVGHNRVFSILAQEIMKIVRLDEKNLTSFRDHSFMKTEEAMIPIVNLEKELEIAGPASEPQILIVCRENTLCLSVRKILKNHETSIHPMPAVLEHVKYAKGIAMSQEGEPILMLDLNYFITEPIQVKHVKKKKENLDNFLIIQTQETSPLIGILTEKVQYIGKLNKVIKHKNQLFFEEKDVIRELIPLDKHHTPKHFAAVKNAKNDVIFLGFERAVSHSQLKKNRNRQMLDKRLVEILEL